MIGALLLLAVSVVPADEEFTCTPTRVWDGDGPVWCAEGPRIRLAGIAAREIDDSCRPNQPCPTAGGAEARDALVKLIGAPTGRSLEGHVLVTGPAMRCVSVGNGVGTRTAAWCVSATMPQRSSCMPAASACAGSGMPRQMGMLTSRRRA